MEQFSAPPLKTLLSDLHLEEKKDAAIRNAVSKCYDTHTTDIHMTPEDCLNFAQCMESAGVNKNDLQSSMPELAQCAGPPSKASGDYNIAPNMYNLYSQIAPQDLASSLLSTQKEGFSVEDDDQAVTGFDPLDEKHAGPSEGFTTAGAQVAMMCMSDPYRHCARKYGTSDWPGYSQCVYTGEGMNSGW